MSQYALNRSGLRESAMFRTSQCIGFPAIGRNERHFKGSIAVPLGRRFQLKRFLRGRQVSTSMRVKAPLPFWVLPGERAVICG
jgi:hypothetical protein